MVDTPHAQPETIVVTLPGEIDMANACRVGADLDAAFGPGVGVVIADMSGTRFCDTPGIHALVMADKRAKASHTGFRVVAGPGEVRRVLEILRLDTVLALYPQLHIALLDSDHDPEQ
jgi:anti-sigma B factor antagonist